MQIIYKDNYLKIKMITVGMISNNVYIIQSAGKTAVVDPSANIDEIILSADGEPIDKILLTHYHWDHIMCGYELKNMTKAETYASYTDAKYIEDTSKAPLKTLEVKSFKVDKKLSEGDVVKIGISKWKVIETPGHTPGSICFYNEDNPNLPILISGDTLFYSSCGRTDFPDSSLQDMRNSLLKLIDLPQHTMVLPGHELTTTIKAERKFILSL